MELQTIKKKLSSFVTDGGYLKNIPDDLLGEILHAWEEWTAPSKEFYAGVGFSQRKMASLIGKAKKLKREGHFGNGNFKELKAPVDIEPSPTHSSVNCHYVEVQTSKGQLIRFPKLSQLMEYLEKAG